MPALAAFLLLAAGATLPPAESAPVELRSGWEARVGDAPWAPWTPGSGFPLVGGERVAWLRTTLPGGTWRAPALFVAGVVQQLEVLVDGQSVFRSPSFEGPLSPWYLVPLPAPTAGRRLELRIESRGLDIGPYGRLAVGAPEALLMQVLASAASAFALAIFTGAMAAAALALWLRRRQDRFYLAFAAWAAIALVRILALDPGRQLLLDRVDVWERALPIARLLGPIAAWGLLCALFPGRHRILRAAFRVSLLPAALLAVALIAALPAVYPLVSRVLNLEFVIGELLILGAIVPAAWRGSRESQALALGYGLHTLAAVHDVATALHFIAGNPYWTHYSQLFVVAAFSSVVLGRLTIVHAELERHAVDLERTNQQLRETDERLEAALAARDDFLSVAAHELRTPLTALRLQTERLQRGAPSPDLPGKLLRQQDRLHALIEKLLDVSRARAGRLSIEPHELDASALVREVASRFSDEAARAGSAMTIEAPELLQVRWDRDRIDQVLTNLIANALKYAAGAPIAVGLQQRGSSALLTVQDGGAGIAPAEQARIFDRFERAGASRNQGGLGLGLWITKEIVLAMGGEVSVQSEPGKGALFTVSLPLSVA